MNSRWTRKTASGPVKASLFLALVATLLLGSSGLVYGHVVYQGADFSNTFNARYGLTVCDRERDGHNTVGEAYSGSRYLGGGIDRRALDGVCAHGTNPYKITSHRTCEVDGGINSNRRWCTRYISEPN